MELQINKDLNLTAHCPSIFLTEKKCKIRLMYVDEELGEEGSDDILVLNGVETTFCRKQL